MALISHDHLQAASLHVSSFFKGTAKTITINGEKWKYLDQGDPQGETILFLHGMGSNKSIWRGQMQGYANDKYRRIAIDIPGACLTQYFSHGKHTLTELARWLDKYLEVLNIEKVHIVSHSTMTLAGTFYASTRPEKIQTLTMMAVPNLFGDAALGPYGTINEFRKDIAVESPDDVAVFFNKMFYSPPKLPKTLLKLMLAEYKRYLPDFLNVIEQYAESLPIIMSHTRRVSCPTLIVNSAHDAYAPLEFTQSLSWHYPKAQVITFEKCGHAIMLEKPREIRYRHNEFLQNGRVSEKTTCGTLLG